MASKLENHMATGYEVKIGDYISRGHEIFKANMGGYIGFTLVYFAISFFINFIPFLNILSSIVVTPCLVFGYHLVSNQISRKNEIPQFNTFFNGFNSAGKLIVIALISMIVFVICMAPFLISVGVSIFALRESSNAEIFSAILAGPLPILGLGLLVMLFFGISWVFAPFIAVFHNQESWSAMETSRKLVAKNWFMIFLFMLVVGLIMGAGILVLGIGMIFTLPLGMCSIYAAFEDIAGVPGENTDDDKIGEIGATI